jgi:hypothetical protein
MKHLKRTICVAVGAASLVAAHSYAQTPAAAVGVTPAPGGGGPSASANPAESLSQPVPTRYTSKIGFFDSDPSLGASYPRVIQLKQFAAGRGQLLATFGRRGPLPIYRSTDNGETWTFLSEVPNLRGQPALFELPTKIGEFPAGTIMAAGTGVADPSSPKRGLDVSYSLDGGKTWKFLSTIIEGGVGRYDPVDRAGLAVQNPVFEPYLYTDSKGRLVAYISDEGFKADGYSQLLEHRVSPDGGRTWGELVFDVAIPDGLARPGMAVVARNAAGKYFMSYEVVGKAGVALEPRSNLAHFKTSMDGLNWGDPSDPGTFIQDRWRQYPNGTPYIVWSPWGGPEGTLLVSARSVLRYNIGRVGNGMMVNRKGGQGLWTLVETPIVYNPELDGYSQTMIPLGDGREILQMVTVNNRVAYAKFELPEKLPEYPFPWGGPKPAPKPSR